MMIHYVEINRHGAEGFFLHLFMDLEVRNKFIHELPEFTDYKFGEYNEVEMHGIPIGLTK